jgi:type IV secretion system protein TrbL
VAVRVATSTASSARSAYQAGSASAGGGLKGAAAGLGNVAKTGAQAAGRRWPMRARSGRRSARGVATAPRAGKAVRLQPPGRRRHRTTHRTQQPAWAKRLHRRQQLTHAATTAAHTLRGGDGGGSSQGPSLRDSDS